MHTTHIRPQYPAQKQRLLETEEGRARLVEATLDFVKDTPLYSQAYEQQMRLQFIKGELTLEQVVQYVDQT